MLLHLRAVDKMSVYSSEAIHSSDVQNGRYAMKSREHTNITVCTVIST